MKQIGLIMFGCLSLPTIACGPNNISAELSDHAWKEPKGTSVEYFEADKDKNNKPINTGTYRIGQSVAKYKIQGGGDICVITFTYTQGNCKGDIHTYRISELGTGFQFKIRFTIDEKSYNTMRMSEAHECEMMDNYILPVN